MTPRVGLYIIIHTSAMATGVATMGRRKIDRTKPLAPEGPVQHEGQGDAEQELERGGETGEVHGQPQGVPEAVVLDEGPAEVPEADELRAGQARGVPRVHAHVERVGDGNAMRRATATTEGRVKTGTGWRSTNRDHPVPT